VGGDGGRDGVDEEGHVVVDDGEAHGAVIFAKASFERDARRARRAGRGGLRDKVGGSGAFGIAEPLKLSRQGSIGKTRLQRIGERLDRLAHARGLCAGIRRGSRLAAPQRDNCDEVAMPALTYDTKLRRAR